MTLTDINFECSTCGQRLVVDAAAAESEVTCPMCSHELKVPRPDRHKLGRPLEAESRAFREEIPPLQRELASVNALSDRLESDLETAYADIKALRLERDRQSAAHSQMAAEMRELRFEKSTLSAELEKQRVLALAEASALQAELEQSEHERTSALRAAAQATSRADALAHEKATFEEALEVSRQRATALETQLTAREVELEERVSCQEGLKLEILELESTLADGRAELDLLSSVAEEHKRLDGTVKELREKLRLAERSVEGLSEERTRLLAEIEGLKVGLNESASGRELVALREKLESVENSRETALRAQRVAQEELEKLDATAARLAEDLECVRRRCHNAERAADEIAPAKIEDDRSVLRGIVQRQQEEIAMRHQELQRLRRAQFALRLAYALVGLCTLGIVAMGVKLAQHAF